MIAELLNPDEVRKGRRDFIARLRGLADEIERKANQPTGANDQAQGLRGLADGLQAEDDAEQKEHEDGRGVGAYIPSAPLTCQLQAGMEQCFRAKGWVATPNQQGLATTRILVSDEHLELPHREALGLAPTVGGMLDESDVLYIASGVFAVLGRLADQFAGREVEFNPLPARPASLGEDARVLLFGDWATGLPRARELAETIAAEAIKNQHGRTQHLIHLGDTYYAGRASEYEQRFLPYWPKTRNAVATHWSLNGNHDMYSGGKGYFDTLLRHPIFSKHHQDENERPSSFFLLENEHWQIFGLDSAFHSPQLRGMDGAIDDAQADFVAGRVDPKKGVILLSHHQLFSARPKEGQAEQIRAALFARGVWKHVNAWLWGHEHRCVLYSSEWSKQRCGLPLGVCLGNGGVPTVEQVEKEWEPKAMEWEYLDGFPSGTRYYKKFAFACLEFGPAADTVALKFFGESGGIEYKTEIRRSDTPHPG